MKKRKFTRNGLLTGLSIGMGESPHINKQELEIPGKVGNGHGRFVLDKGGNGANHFFFSIKWQLIKSRIIARSKNSGKMFHELVRLLKK